LTQRGFDLYVVPSWLLAALFRARTADLSELAALSA
jgi:hypothetical protein